MIILYDIASSISAKSHPSASPNTLKARIALNYKRIPFTTEYVEYHKIQDVIKSIGGPFSPFPSFPVGSPKYTLPTIRDTATGAVVTDSAGIAEYLDKTYPDSPSGPLFPHGARAAIALFEQTFKSASFALFPIIGPTVHRVLDPISQPYFRGLNEGLLQKKMEELPRPGNPEYEAILQKCEEIFGQLARLYERNEGGENSLWFLGDRFSYADVVAAAFVSSIIILLGEDSEEWKRVSSWDGGRWARLVDATACLRTDVSNERSGAESK